MRRRLSRKERERRRRLIQAALIAVVIIIAIAIIFLVKGCADRKKSADKANNSSVVNETTQQGINMTETENNSTASTVKDKTESVSEQNENNTSGSNDNSAAGGGDSGFENIGKTSKGFNIQVKNGATYIDGYLIANKTYALPSTFVPENPETPVTEARSNKSLDKDLMAAFRKMQADATADGLNIYIASGYRSYDYQVSLYNRYVARMERQQLIHTLQDLVTLNIRQAYALTLTQ